VGCLDIPLPDADVELAVHKVGKRMPSFDYAAAQFSILVFQPLELHAHSMIQARQYSRGPSSTLLDLKTVVLLI
jgi:hypothetical protein